MKRVKQRHRKEAGVRVPPRFMRHTLDEKHIPGSNFIDTVSCSNSELGSMGAVIRTGAQGSGSQA